MVRFCLHARRCAVMVPVRAGCWTLLVRPRCRRV